MNDDEPLAYTIGDQPFLGLTIYLDSRPLIPRPETEWWTEQLLRDAEKIFPATGCPRAKPGPEGAEKSSPRGIKFLDLCAGSGAIGCAALAKLPDAEVYFGEIDPAHEATILKNIRENHLDLPAGRQASRAHVCIGDLFEPFDALTFDVVAANPPYVPADRELPASVIGYEPPQALFAGSDGLDVIRRIASALPNYLVRDGVAWIECDSMHAETARALFQNRGFNAEILDDQYGQPRVICARMI